MSVLRVRLRAVMLFEFQYHCAIGMLDLAYHSCPLQLLSGLRHTVLCLLDLLPRGTGKATRVRINKDMQGMARGGDKLESFQLGRLVVLILGIAQVSTNQGKSGHN